MKKYMLVLIVTLGLVCAGGGYGLAGDVGYRFRPDTEFGLRPQGPPSSAEVAADALIARPLGLATTIVGAGVFVATLPFSLPSHSVKQAARGLVVQPGGWTFGRPLGGTAPQFGERGVFKY